MKVIEPISSSVFITACAYAAGISHNNAFMRKFGIDPEFSQPSVEKALYDGGIVTFETFYDHILAVANFAKSGITITILALLALGAAILAAAFRNKLPQAKKLISLTINHIPTGLIGIAYFMFLTFSAFNKGAEKGEALAIKFIKTCNWVEMVKDKEKHRACAFKKDNDAIWYFDIETADSKAEAKQLSELDSITYLKRQRLIE
ncbi:hypothetical protein [Metapseudomonas otitidis]|uniref:Uncharacterized protein n=1 Tax=Metapseudomonas otitidis TaxID=319939 RepID=A0A679GRC2_9GAMM|nr:hypothetical protein [Pseudomonas otitidis]BCA30918.1 hypothetical protein PtoMrB4_48950 [Pseudomonas otitidis]